MSQPLGLGKTRFAALLLSAALGLAACHSTETGGGTVQVGLTDAAGDFLSYAVDVTSLTLTRADGTVAQTLPQKTRVDLAQLADLTEFVTSATIETGSYVSATLVLDYSQADIQVDNGLGVAVPVPLANIKDAQGVAITAPVSMKVQFDNARQLTIAPLVPALLDLDFSLAASNTVDMSNPSSPVVTVSPLLVADVAPDSPKPHRIRGPLDTVNTQAGSFTLFLRPFNLVQGDHGRLTFLTDANTAFEVDQAPFVGAAGLSALSQKARLTTAVVAIGTLVPGTRQFLATEVRAGTGVPFGTADVLTGNVIARLNNTLTVKGAELVRADGTLVFRDTVSVTVGAGTKVIKQATAGSFTIGDISVGQRVTLFGTLTSITVGSTAMDATAGLARLLLTQLNGTVSGVSGATIGMTLARIDGRPVGLFDFAGTGTTGNDADPTAYVVATGLLPLAGIVSGTPVKVRGFVQPFGQAAATDDFNAVTLIDVTHSPATLLVGWPVLEAAPFSFFQGGMSVSLSNAGLLHDVVRDGVDTRLLTSDAPVVQAANQGRGLFVIGIGGTAQVFTQFGAYQQALQANLGTGLRARAFVASGGAGSYVDATKTLTAGAMAAVLQ
jgi:uncharacterized protein DUF4382